MIEGGARRTLALAFAAGVAMALFAVAAGRLPLESPSEEAYLDRLFRSRSGARAGSDERVMIVHFDRRTFTALGTTWQEFAPHLTRLVDRLREGGARVIGMDMGVAFLDDGPAGRAFLETCARAGNVVFTSVLARAAPDAAPVSRPVAAAVARAEVPAGFANFVVDGKGARENRGRVIRAVSLQAKVGERTASAFALEVARRALGAPASVEPGRVLVGPRAVPLEDGLLRVDYPGGEYFHSIGAEAFLGDNSKLREISMRAVAGKVVLVGADYQAMGDHHLTPFGDRPGVMIQAAVVRTLLAGRPLRPLPGPVGPLLALVVSLGVGALFARLPRGRALAASLAVPPVLHVAALAAFEAGVWLPVLFAILAAPVTGVALWGLDPRRAAAPAAAPLDATQAGGGPAKPRDWGEGDLVLRVARDVVSARYRDVSLLGRGGMGVVLRAFDPQREQHVAVKILSPLLTDRPHLVHRFLREIRALRTVAHPGVVEIMDVEESGETPYYSMELIEGVDLRRRLHDVGTFDDQEARDVFTQLWEVLAHIHTHGVIHRDLKPDNILLTKTGRLKLLDFGLAHVPEASALTQDGEVMGTLRYMSPEQMEGRELTPASDVFSAALVVFEAMTGRMPFPEIGRVLNYSGTITAMNALRPSARPGLSELIMTCLAPVPEQRPADAGRVARRWAACWTAPYATQPGGLS